MGFVCSLALAALLAIWALPAFALSICAPMVLDGVVIHEETAGYDIDVKYPVLCEDDATRVIRDHVVRALSDFKKEFPEHDLTEYRHKHVMQTDYLVWTAGDGRLASVKIDTMIFTGGAHPNTTPKIWIFDMSDGDVLDLDDVFIDVKEALIEIAPIVQSVVAERLGRMNQPDMLVDGTTSVASNYDDFVLTEEGVTFFFARYQVAPYAAGEQVVTVPYPRLVGFLRPEILEVVTSFP